MDDEQKTYKGVEDVASLLGRAGEKVRERDMSEDAIRRTRAEVTGLLQERVVDRSSLILFQRRALVAAAAVVLLVAGLLVHRAFKTVRRPGPVEAMFLETEIDTRRRDLAYQLEQFRMQYGQRIMPTPYERETGDLKRRLDRHRLQLERELKAIQTRHPAGTASLEEDTFNIESDDYDKKEG